MRVAYCSRVEVAGRNKPGELISAWVRDPRGWDAGSWIRLELE